MVQVNLRVPPAFRETLRRVVGKRMAETGEKITEGEVLFALVRAAAEEQS